MVLMRTDPFRELDRLTRRAFMPMDAWREGERFLVEFDLPGLEPDSIDLDVERNVGTVRAERPVPEGVGGRLAAERPRGVFSRQLTLSENPDLDKIIANYHDGVLRLVIPVAERTKRRITVDTAGGEGRTIEGGTVEGSSGFEAQDTSQQTVTVS